MNKNQFDTRLQVPMSKILIEKAKKRAENLGYSSVQEIVRVFLKGLIDEKYEPTVEFRETLGDKAAKRYEKMLNDVLSGKEKTYTYDPNKSLAEQFGDIDEN